METNGVLIRATDLAAGYGRRNVLEGITFEVRQGESWFFIGPNGCGKTTLVRVLLGLLDPRQGSLELHPELADRQRLGFVPQRHEITAALPMTLREFVALGAVRSRLRRAEQAERLRWALARVGLEAEADRDFRTLSGGQRQRALIARALVRRPELLILDEPTSGLDVPATASLLEFLSDLNRREGATLVVVTHDLSIAARHASHAGLFREGRLLAGPCREMLTRKHLEHIYGVPVDVPGFDDDGPDAGSPAEARA